MVATTQSNRPLALPNWSPLLAAAIRGEGVRPVFQPIVDLRRNRVVGYEALTRFDIPGADGLGPDAWFAAAEDEGIGAELDATALEKVFLHRSDLPQNCFLTVNVDPNHLTHPALSSVLATQASLGGLVIEFTEHREWEWAPLESTVDMLRAEGAVMAIDDAGAGYSGLQQMLKLRPQILKLDRSIIEGIDRDESKVALVEMMGVFANRVDAWILAEGVETAAEARRLHDLGVPLVQGFFFGRPSAPWTGVTDDAREKMAGLQAIADAEHSLVALLDDVAPLSHDQIRQHDWADSNDQWKPVVDARRRPIGVVDPVAAFDGELLAALVANVESDPREIAQRIATAVSDPCLPVVVIDDLGEYLGLVTMRRLLSHLAVSDA